MAALLLEPALVGIEATFLCAIDGPRRCGRHVVCAPESPPRGHLQIDGDQATTKISSEAMLGGQIGSYQVVELLVVYPCVPSIVDLELVRLGQKNTTGVGMLAGDLVDAALLGQSF